MSERTDLTDPDFLADPHASWAQLRESGPVHGVYAEDGSPAWLVTRYETVRERHLDSRLTVDKRASNGGYSGFSLPPELDENLLNRDGETHSRLRRLVSGAFTPRRVRSLRGRLDEIAHALIDDFDADHVDLVSEYSVPLSATVIGHMLGVPESERAQFKTWTNGMFSRDREEVATSIRYIYTYLRELIDVKRTQPDDDLLSDLVALHDGADRLSRDELLSTAMLLMLAGYESPVHALGNGIVALLTHPQQWRELRERPELVPTAVEEILRFDPPNSLSIRRFATEDMEIEGCPVKAGDTVLYGKAAALRDPRQYDNPDTFDIHRQPQHIAFGRGTHFCLGAPLGRAEVEIAITTLLTRCPDLTLSCPPEQLTWRQSARSHGLVCLPACPSSPSPVKEGRHAGLSG